MNFNEYWELKECEVRIQELEDEVADLEIRCQHLQDENYELQHQLEESGYGYVERVEYDD